MVQLSEIQISDIFFNFEHPALQGYFNSAKEPDQFSDEAKEALMEDAKTFSEMVDNQVSAKWLCDDYLKRV